MLILIHTTFAFQFPQTIRLAEFSRIIQLSPPRLKFPKFAPRNALNIARQSFRFGKPDKQINIAVFIGFAARKRTENGAKFDVVALANLDDLLFRLKLNSYFQNKITLLRWISCQ